jgi:Domain of unknown function (DUF4365)
MRRPQQHRIGDIGELRVAHAFVQYGWIVDKLHSDYGFDFLLQRVDKERVTGDFALLQVKATEAESDPGTASPPALRIAAKHQRLWESTPIPTFLVLVDLKEDRLFVASCRGLTAVRMCTGRDNDELSKEDSQRVRPDQFMLLTTESASQIAVEVAEYWARFRATMLSSGAVAHLIPGLGTVATSMVPIVSLLRFNSKLAEVLGYELADSVTMDVMRSLVGREKRLPSGCQPKKPELP